MTGRTHDLAAFTALTFIVATLPIPQISLATAFVAFGANMIGGLAPDIDQTTGELWGRIRGGSVLSRMIAPLLGGHRYISHSVLGVVLFGFVVQKFLELTQSVLIVDGPVVWWSFMIGFVSHLLMDTITRDGVPWLFPIPIKFGIPPFRFLRIKTGGLLEKSFIFPGLLLLNCYLFYAFHSKFLDVLHKYIK